MARVTVWNEYRHERESDAVAEVYPDGIHEAIADGLERRGHEVRTATLDDPEHGLPPEVLAETDVLVWWGHMAHDEVADEVVDRVVDRVQDGMGFLPLHSAHFSKPFRRLTGTPCTVQWREADERERVWPVDPDHPVARSLDGPLIRPQAETYGEPFGIPEPDELVFVSWFEGGEVFRSGCCYRRGSGRIFYFRPGHETYPVFHEAEIRDVLADAVTWAARPDRDAREWDNHHVPEPPESE
ncbi:MAG: ThuA domain-containing protein [Haloarculaceae archaeon]